MMQRTGVYILLTGLLCLVIYGCSQRHPSVAEATHGGGTPAPWDLVEEGEAPPSTRMSDTSASPGPEDETSAEATDSIPEMSDSIVNADLSKYRAIGRLDEIFNDSNKYQYAAGERIGIRPISDLGGAYFTGRPLVKIESNELYSVDRLTHSMPYLVPEASALLESIGRNFRDSLKAKGLGAHRFRVTSLLRSAHSVKKLRRVNRNATDSSTHQLGTTFDISYANFEYDPASKPVGDAELKYVLGEVLRDLRAANKCLVKYERKSPCFHITATGR